MHLGTIHAKTVGSVGIVVGVGVGAKPVAELLLRLHLLLQMALAGVDG